MSFLEKAVTLGTSDADIYICPALQSGSAHGIVFSNITGGAITVGLKLYSQATGVTTPIITALNIPANSPVAWPKPINMVAGDKIIASASAGASVVALLSLYLATAAPAAVGLTPRGAHDGAANYVPNDLVTLGGVSYICVTANTADAPPSVNWMVLASPSNDTDAVTEGSSNFYFTAARVRAVILTGLSTATNAVVTATSTVLEAIGLLQKQHTDHVADTSNPHSVTKAQVGLGNVDNTSDVNKPVSTAQLAAINALLGANDAEVYKGVIDCSANPNYPAADAGEVYRVSVAGKIGGASGTNVEVNDRLQCIVDGTASGTQAGVGANWWITQGNIDGAVVGPASSVNNRVAFFSGTSGKLIADSGLTLSGSNTGDETATTIGALIAAAVAKATPVDADMVGLVDSAASNVIKKTTWANVKATLKTYFDTIYESLTNKDATGGYVGLTLFKINFKNAANTFTSFFTNANTAARTYTFPDFDGTVATTGGAETFTNKTLTAPTINGGTHTAITSFGIRSTGAAFDLTMATSEVLTAGRTLSWVMGDAARSITLGGNLSFANSFTTSGNFAITITATAASSPTLPAGADTLAGLGTAQTFTKAQRGAVVTLTDAATVALDFSLGNQYTLNIAGNRTLGVPTNPVAGQSGSIEVVQDPTGSRTLAYSWPYTWAGGTAGTLSTAGCTNDQLVYEVDFYNTAAVTITSATPAVMTWAGHNMVTGQRLQLTNAGGALNTGLSVNTTYWFTKIDANSGKLSSSLANCAAGTFINTTSAGTGTQTATAMTIKLALNKAYA